MEGQGVVQALEVTSRVEEGPVGQNPVPIRIIRHVPYLVCDADDVLDLHSLDMQDRLVVNSVLNVLSDVTLGVKVTVCEWL